MAWRSEYGGLNENGHYKLMYIWMLSQQAGGSWGKIRIYSLDGGGVTEVGFEVSKAHSKSNICLCLSASVSLSAPPRPPPPQPRHHSLVPEYQAAKLSAIVPAPCLSAFLLPTTMIMDYLKLWDCESLIKCFLLKPSPWFFTATEQ